MSKLKVGDRVRALVDATDITKGKIYEITEVSSWEVTVRDDRGDLNSLLDDFQWEPVEEAPKGTFERLMVEALPQGGYKVTAAGQTYALTHNELAAFTTLKEAVEFVGRNMR